MPKLGPLGSVRGARGNLRPYRDTLRRRVVMNLSVVKTRTVSSSWDKPARRLMTGWAATGVEGA